MMPHRCVRCGKIYDDGSQEILKGCSCGAKLFFYVKKQALLKASETFDNISVEDREQIEKDVLDIVGVKEENPEDATVVLDFESISIKKPGKFELDLVNLFNKKNPLVYKLEEGKYVIDIAESFKRERESRDDD